MTSSQRNSKCSTRQWHRCQRGNQHTECDRARDRLKVPPVKVLFLLAGHLPSVMVRDRQRFAMRPASEQMIHRLRAKTANVRNMQMRAKRRRVRQSDWHGCLRVFIGPWFYLHRHHSHCLGRSLKTMPIGDCTSAWEESLSQRRDKAALVGDHTLLSLAPHLPNRARKL